MQQSKPRKSKCRQRREQYTFKSRQVNEEKNKHVPQHEVQAQVEKVGQKQPIVSLNVGTKSLSKKKRKVGTI